MNPAAPTPPQAIEAEQSVLGAMMIAPETVTRITSALTERDFYRADHRAIFRAIKSLHESGTTPDPVTVGEFPGLADAVSDGYVIDLVTGTHSAANVDAYAQLVRRASVKRQLSDLGTEITNRGLNCAEPEDISAFGIAQLTTIARQLAPADFEPLDVFGDADVPELRPEWLPPGMAEYATDQARLMGAPLEMLAMGCLGAVAAALHDDFVIAPKPNEPKWRERACLWIMAIAPPGSMKSSAIERPMGPLKRMHDLMKAKHRAAMADYVPREREHLIREKDATKRRAKGEGYDEPAAPPEKPRNEAIFIRDATTESLGELLVDNPRGLTFLHDELSLWFGTFDAYRNKGSGSKDRPYALQAYGGGSASFNRIGRGEVLVPNWSYSVIGTIQPDKVRGIAKDNPDDGLFQRFMAIEVGRSEAGADHDYIERAQVTRDYQDALEAVYKFNPAGESVVRLSPEAVAEFREFSDWVERMTRNDALAPMLLGHLSKWKGLWPRLALVYHAWGCARGGKHPLAVAVTERTAKRVTAFMQRFLLPQSMRFYQHTLGEASPVTLLVRGIASMVLGDGLATITNREMHRGCNAWREATEWQRKSALGILTDGGWLTRTGDGLYAVSPAVHASYADRAAKEGARRRRAATLLGELRAAAAGRADER